LVPAVLPKNQALAVREATFGWPFLLAVAVPYTSVYTSGVKDLTGDGCGYYRDAEDAKGSTAHRG
jgi:hypothetical protein